MAKGSGGIRSVTTCTEDTYEENYSEYMFYLSTGQYETDPEKTYISPSGAYVLVDKHHNFSEEEMEVAKALADKGIIVELTNEHDVKFATSYSRDGKPRFCEGRLSVEKLSYEQKTPKEVNVSAVKSVKSALLHAKNKGADIALIYDKNRLYHREDIDEGIKYFEKIGKYRFKAIFVIDAEGNVYEWYHDL